MTLESINQFCSSLLAYAGESAVRSIALALAVGLVVSAARVKHPRLRLIPWTVVLYSAMIMPLLGLVLPAINVRLLPAARRITAGPGGTAPPTLTESRFSPSAGGSDAAAETAGGFAPKTAPDNHTVTQTQFAAGLVEPKDSGFGLWGLAAIVYLLGVAILLARVATGLILCRRLRNRAHQISDSEIGWLLHQLSGLPVRSTQVKVAESSSVSVPVAIGALDPMILLPPGWREWEPQKLRAVLAHELSHVARRDAMTQLISAVHRSIFWFSPLPWWLHRRLTDLAEQASDDSAVLAIQDPAFYAEVLLGFFQSLNGIPARWLGVSMARGARAGRRIERMLSGAPPSSALVRGRAVATVVMLIVALTVATASLRIGQASAADQNRNKASRRGSTGRSSAPLVATSDPASATESRLAPSDGVVGSSGPGVEASAFAGDESIQQAAPTPQSAAAAPSTPASPAAVAPVVPVMALPFPASASPAIAGSTPFAAIAPLARLMALPPPAAQDRTEDRRESFAIVTRDGSRMTGTWSFDEENMRSLRNKIKGDFIWFKHDGRGYVVTDHATIKAALEFFAPQEELGQRQAELGRQQALLGEKQADLSRQMAAVNVEMPDLTADLARISDRMKGARTQDELSELQSELSRLQSRLSAAQSQASREQSRFGQLQSELGRQQSELGRQQSLLGQEQSRLAREADKKVRLLLERALSDGLAQPEP